MAGELEFSEKLRVYREESKENEKTSKLRKFFSLWPYRVLLLVFLWLELFFTAGCLITLLNFSVDISLLLGVGAVCGLLWFLFFSMHTRWRYLFLIIYSAAGIFLCFFYFDAIREGFFYVGKAFNQAFYTYYKISLFPFRPSGEEEFCCAVFLGVLLQPIAACYALSLFRARAKSASMGFLAFFSLLGLAIGLIPEPLFFIGAFFCALLQIAFSGAVSEYLMQDGKIKKEYGDGQKRRAKIAFLFCVLAVLVSFPILQVIDSDYQRSIHMREKKQQLQMEMERIAAMPVWKKAASVFRDFSLFSNTKGSGTARIGGLNSGRFSRAAQISFDNVTALFVTLPELDSSVYLRGYTGARYTKEGWEELDKDAIKEYHAIREEYEISSQEQGYRLMDLIYRNQESILRKYIHLGEGARICCGEMKVEYVTANRDFVYAPYYINPLERGGYHYEQDGYLTSPAREEVYDYTFLMPSLEFLCHFGELTDQGRKISLPFDEWQADMETLQYLQFSDAYQDFVYRYYTEIPEENKGVKELFLDVKDASINEKIGMVQQVLSKYQYTLSPGDIPLDADFVNYFLFENKKGYCVHFASSAVLMLRSLGVPARYAEGYLITQKDIANAEAVAAQTISDMELTGKNSGYEIEKKPPSTRIVLQKCVDVRDYTAHAWVEVYMNEIGWVPVEMTVGYMDSETIQRPAEIMQEVSHLPSPTPFPTRKVTPTPPPTSTPIPTQTEFPKISGEEEDVFANMPEHSESLEESTIVPSRTSPSPSISAEKNGTDMQKNGYFVKLPLWAKLFFAVGLLFLCLLGFLFLRYFLVCQIRGRKRTRKKQVLWYYAQMERVLRHMGLVPLEAEGYEEFAGRVKESEIGAAVDFARCQRTALMADFGREHITKEQAAFLAENYEKMRMELFGKSKRIRKYYLKFIKIY